jgi:hypothetical protein
VSMRLTCDERDLGIISDSFQFMLFQLVLSKLSAVQKTVKLLWVAYLSLAYLSLILHSLIYFSDFLYKPLLNCFSKVDNTPEILRFDKPLLNDFTNCFAFGLILEIKRCVETSSIIGSSI